MSAGEAVALAFGIVLSFLAGFMLGRVYEFMVWTVKLTSV